MPANEAGSPAQAIRVLVVDDHRMFTENLVRLLDDEHDIDVVGTAARISEATDAVARTTPDIVLLDYLLPDGDGTLAIHEIRRIAPGTKVVVLTALNDEAALMAALGAGCDGFVTKDRASDELVHAVRAVAAGEVQIPPDLLARALPRLRRRESNARTLTRRELEVLELLAEGMSNPEIAGRLHISINTVRNHVQNLLTKLGAHSRLEAVALGIRQGLVSGPGRRQR